MKTNFSCLVCESKTWTTLERYSMRERKVPTFSRWKRAAELGKVAARILFFARPSKRILERKFLNRSEIERQKIYREVWGGGDLLTSILCQRCGFVCYDPRPTSEDISAKYAFLKEKNPDVGGQNLSDPVLVRMDRERSLIVYEKVKAYATGISVLDYGGGNGKIMYAFSENGYKCYLADYSDVQLPNVEKVANDINNLEGRYSVIVLSHVLEHVAEPGELISRLRNHLEDDGVVYAEIPIDILGGLRLEGDPATHINFFTQESLSVLFNKNGYGVIKGDTEISSYGKQVLEVGWLLAKKDDAAASYKPEAAKRLLWPNRLYAFRKLLVEARK